ncbi:MAG: hypothetical protein MZW92_69575, partial [Comamonadaceae bacterium]|nr:hypothetical protein [Comamonadaceae bacterium]
VLRSGYIIAKVKQTTTNGIDSTYARFEEETIFPLASGLDLQELGARLVAGRIELIGNYDQPD